MKRPPIISTMAQHRSVLLAIWLKELGEYPDS